MAVSQGLIGPQGRSASNVELRRRSVRIRRYMSVFGAMHFAERVGPPEPAPARRADG